MRLEAGESLLITGPSGTGKTTLLRSLARLWPFTSGTLRRPHDDTMFLLAASVPAPRLPARGPFVPRRPPPNSPTPRPAPCCTPSRWPTSGNLDLEEAGDWARRLSPGEQQRLSFGRILLRKPALIFLDESTSAMDEGMEHAMYEHVREGCCPSARSSASAIVPRSNSTTTGGSSCSATALGIGSGLAGLEG